MTGHIGEHFSFLNPMEMRSCHLFDLKNRMTLENWLYSQSPLALNNSHFQDTHLFGYTYKSHLHLLLLTLVEFLKYDNVLCTLVSWINTAGTEAFLSSANI